MIGRNTTWRQGSLIKQEELVRIGLSIDPSHQVIVISHDCDIPHKGEEIIEALVCPTVQPEKIFQDCKNPRKLHLRIDSPEDNNIHIELNFKNRILISKAQFMEELSGPQDNSYLSDSEKRTLKQWLSSRYGRPAYPNAFEDHLRVRIGKYSVERLFSELVAPVAEHIVGIFIGLDGDKNIELPTGEPYCLSIFIVYRTDLNALTARTASEKLSDEITALFLKAYGEPEGAKAICLEKCSAIADTRITLADLMKVDQWRLEWLSLAEGDDEFVSVGEI